MLSMLISASIFKIIIFMNGTAPMERSLSNEEELDLSNVNENIFRN